MFSGVEILSAKLDAHITDCFRNDTSHSLAVRLEYFYHLGNVLVHLQEHPRLTPYLRNKESGGGGGGAGGRNGEEEEVENMSNKNNTTTKDQASHQQQEEEDEAHDAAETPAIPSTYKHFFSLPSFINFLQRSYVKEILFSYLESVKGTDDDAWAAVDFFLSFLELELSGEGDDIVPLGSAAVSGVGEEEGEGEEEEEDDMEIYMSDEEEEEMEMEEEEEEEEDVQAQVQGQALEKKRRRPTREASITKRKKKKMGKEKKEQATLEGITFLAPELKTWFVSKIW